MRGTATEPRIGPNAISRLADCLTREGRTGEAEAVFGAAGLRRYLDTPPGEMVPEADVVALYGALFATLGPVRAKAMARSAGAATARYLLAHRIPRLVQAVLRLSVDSKLKLPIDSSAAITSEGLLGGNYIALTPGAEADMLKDGGEIAETSGAPDLMSLIGSVVNRSGGDAPAASPAPADAPPQ